ncbi:metallophosphoesterase [Rhizobium sp. CFBP 13726]|uniref:metallophosphoesterase n=1 Tax=Rhizobium sp. CFBP 13726 TaxID=2775296 RepID=UPI00177B5A1B|nr:metallophosphoesterase [Rhizobium sp. CFBP 13726]MBD8651154.1 metallophosphoesterase [Rhizobium sp. CFBP 13726]
MKIWLISDMHSSPLDLLYGNMLDVPEADLCVCAGDVAGSIERTMNYVFSEIAHRMPVVMTLGNHDYHGSSIDQTLDYVRREIAGTNVHVLENDELRKGDLRIIGATLWTDYAVRAHASGRLPIDQRRAAAMEACYRVMVDFRTVRASGGHGGSSLITPDELYSRHKESRAYIERKLKEPFQGTTMVLTHHALTPRSLDPRFRGQLSNAAFASDLSAVIEKGRPAFWVHGHVHRFCDYIQSETRMICNPLGYQRERGKWTGFRPSFVIETTPEGRG